MVKFNKGKIMTKWRPMNTAPKDGSFIYGLFQSEHGENIEAIRWNEKIRYGEPLHGLYCFNKAGWEEPFDKKPMPKPDGWMTWEEHRKNNLDGFKKQWEKLKAQHDEKKWHEINDEF